MTDRLVVSQFEQYGSGGKKRQSAAQEQFMPEHCISTDTGLVLLSYQHVK
jgi:hypothetical protein